MPPARAIYQNLTHGAGGGAEKVPTIVEAVGIRTQQLQEGLVDQCGGLQRLLATTAQKAARESAKLGVEHRDQLLARLGIFTPAGQQAGDIGVIGIGHGVDIDGQGQSGAAETPCLGSEDNRVRTGGRGFVPILRMDREDLDGEFS